MWYVITVSFFIKGRSRQKPLYLHFARPAIFWEESSRFCQRAAVKVSFPLHPVTDIRPPSRFKLKISAVRIPGRSSRPPAALPSPPVMYDEAKIKSPRISFAHPLMKYFLGGRAHKSATWKNKADGYIKTCMHRGGKKRRCRKKGAAMRTPPWRRWRRRRRRRVGRPRD